MNQNPREGEREKIIVSWKIYTFVAEGIVLNAMSLGLLDEAQAS